jgi:hypothetical protein
LRRLALPARIVLGQIDLADDAKNVIGVAVALLHPFGDVSAGPYFPFMDVWLMSKLFQLLADPECPVSVAAGVADKNIRHALLPDTVVRVSSSQAASGRAAK